MKANSTGNRFSSLLVLLLLFSQVGTNSVYAVEQGFFNDKPRNTGGILELPATASEKEKAATQKEIKDCLPHDSEAKVNFDKLVDDYFAFEFKENPDFATESGIHDFDDKLENLSKENIENRIKVLKDYLGKLSNISDKDLDQFSNFDRQILMSHIQANLLEFGSIQDWRHDPNTYPSIASASILSLVKRDFAPLKDRMKLVIAREEQIPTLLNQGKENLADTPKIYTEIALEQLPDIISFFESSLPEAFATIDDPQLRKQFETANKAVVDGFKDYKMHLVKNVLPASKTEFAIGSDNFKKKVLYEEMVDEPLDVLLKNGYAELARLQEKFKKVANEIDPKHSPQAVIVKITHDHCSAGELLKSVSSVLAQLRQFCLDKNIVTIPMEENLKVEETPAYRRAISLASMDTAGPYEMKAKEAFYYVTLPNKNWDAKKIDEYLSSFSKQDLLNTSVHEAFPGHYVQGLWIRQAPSKTRKLLACDSNMEGWAHYCEEMMVEEGLGSKELQLVQIHDALLRVCRYIVGISMHTQGMTMAQGEQFFMKEGYWEHAIAEKETKRGTKDPTYLVYTLGKLQILSLRDEYKRLKGSSFSLKDFHNNYLAQGAPPIKIVRSALLAGLAKQ